MRAALVLIVLAAGACRMGPPRVPPPRPEAIPVPPPHPGNGSLWHPERAGNYAFLDVRAHFPGDLLTVLVAEQSQGTKNATTTATADTSIAANVQDFFGIPASTVKLLPKGFNPESVVQAKSSRSSKGDGETTRSGDLTASITVTVVGVDTAGNLRVQGDKIISVNNEEQYIVLSGVVRPEDIASDNSVQSSRLGDARIDYYGRGVVADKQNVPLVHRAFDWIWPF